jgi:hypothetical protein
MNNGMNNMKVANTRIIVMAEFASFVLSTNMDKRIPIPINTNPIKNSNINIRIGL